MRTLSSSLTRRALGVTPSRLLSLALVVAGLVVPDSFGAVEAKTPGTTYCFNGTCHRVFSIAETEALVGSEETISTSFYDSCQVDPSNPCGLTSSGEVFRPDAADNGASPIYPDGTTLLVWAPETREAAVIRVNNAGPYWGDRKLDVSRATAERLGFKERGVFDLKVRVIDAPGAAEATYQERRSYGRLPGSIGQYDSLDAAQAGMAAVMGLEAIAGSVLAPLAGGLIVAARAELTGSANSVAVAAAPVSGAANPATEVVALADGESQDGATESRASSATPVAARSRPEAKRDAQTSRPTRAARIAAQNKVSRLAKRGKGPTLASAKPAARPRPSNVAGDPNDMSVFSRYRAGSSA